MNIVEIKEKFEGRLLEKENVNGVAIGYKVKDGEKTDKLAIIIDVEKKLPIEELRRKDIIPTELEGFVTDVIELGKIKALDVDPTQKFRPAPGGVSIGHKDITAGTFGCAVKDPSGNRLILSNNHVLANSNEASIGDPILQPGPYDGGIVERDEIGVLKDFVKIDFDDVPDNPCPFAKAFIDVGNYFAKALGSKYRVDLTTQVENEVDAAIASPNDEADILDEILEIGLIDGFMSPTLGLAVKKFGRTTKLTEGTIQQINATVVINYGDGKKATFVNQFITEKMGAGGDSGSLIVSDSKAVGLLFAGSDTSIIANPIKPVMDKLNIEF